MQVLYPSLIPLRALSFDIGKRGSQHAREGSEKPSMLTSTMRQTASRSSDSAGGRPKPSRRSYGNGGVPLCMHVGAASFSSY
jgi:hypothetical protein